MESNSLTSKPKYEISPDLTKFEISPSEYLHNHADNPNVLVVGACIIAKPKSTPTGDKPHLLLVQRAATERGFPNFWEVPGGSAEQRDATVLDALVREVNEEAGMVIKKFVRLVEPAMQFTTRKGKWTKLWVKLSFLVEVDEEKVGLDGTLFEHSEVSNVGRVMTDRVVGFPKVKLNPEEHQKYLWLTKDDIEKCEKSGSGHPTIILNNGGEHLRLVSDDQHKVMLGAF